ncbi:MAG: M61 family metallopeptidase [Steroidobacteraceae bacterium]
MTPRYKNGFRTICIASLSWLANTAAAEIVRVPTARPMAYPGTIALAVDVTDLEHRVFSVQERIPVRAGPLTLLYPEWLPGGHAPRGTIAALGGLVIAAGEQRLEWTRDSTNVFAFHTKIPAGVSAIDVRFQYASPVVGDQGRTVVTPHIVGLQWTSVVLYPAGYAVSRIKFAPSLTLPPGWEFGSALDVREKDGQKVVFEVTPLETLIDSPLFAGRYFRRVDLAPGATRPVNLDIVADAAADLQISSEQLLAHRKLVQQMYALFGSQHYEHYDFLLALSEAFGGIGLEHHRSSENRQPPGYFTEGEKYATTRDLVAHEFTHSWNGKFRRPSGHLVLNFNTPLDNDLLWVYEGLTQYYGHVLAARSGLWTDELARGQLAQVAANLDRNRPGRTWRPLQDTVNQPVVTPREPLSFVSWQRTEEYYAEGELIWLDVDTRIRELTAGHRSLDDFAHEFYGIQDGTRGPLGYTFDDVVAALNDVAANDWKTFLRTRLDSYGPGAPLEGLSRGGWRVVFKDTPSGYLKSFEESDNTIDLIHSLGLRVSSREAGSIEEVAWDGPAFRAGLTMGGVILAVNGYAFKAEALRAAVKNAKDGTTPIELIVRNGDRYQTVRIPYYGGLRYPQLERADGIDRLSDILKPRT